MTSIEKLEAILIREKQKEWEKNNPPELTKDIWEEFNKLAIKNNSPDLVRHPWGIRSKPLNQTLWKKIHITPELEYKNNIIMMGMYKNAIKTLILACFYPFIVMLFLLAL